jgi:hypothetical protein
VKPLILIFLSALLFLGNIGIPVFTHACEEDGVFTSFFIQQQNHCQEEKEVSNLPPCCQKEEKKNCCHDEKTVIQLDEKYVQSQALSVPIFAFICPEKIAPSYFHGSPKMDISVVQTWADPPPIKESGRDILIQHCVFRL